MFAIRNCVLVPVLSAVAAAQSGGNVTPVQNPASPPPAQAKESESQATQPKAAQQGTQSPGTQSPVTQSPGTQAKGTQSKGAQSKGGKQDAVEQVVSDLRDDLLAGKTLRSHVRVTLRLTNGNKLRGIVKDGKLVESPDGLRFAKGDAADGTDTIKLWYAEGRNSYVVLAFSEVKDYLVQERLTTEQLRTIEHKIAGEEKAAADRLAAQKAAEGDKSGAAGEPALDQGSDQQPPAGETGGAAKTAGTGAATPKPGEGAFTDEQKKMFALLQEFPPNAGWSAKKRDEIKSRVAVVGADPSKTEKRFCEVFADWQKACTAFGAAATPPPAGGTEEKAGDSKDKKRNGAAAAPAPAAGAEQSSDDPKDKKRKRRE